MSNLATVVIKSNVSLDHGKYWSSLAELRNFDEF